VGLAYSRGAPNPYPLDIWGVNLGERVELVGVQTLLYFEVLFDADKSLFNALLRPELQDLLVAFLSVALDILASWLDAELPWAFDAGVLLHAVVGRAIVAFDDLKMGAFTVFL